MKFRLSWILMVVFGFCSFGAHARGGPPPGAGNVTALIAELQAQVDANAANISALQVFATTRADAGLYMMTMYEVSVDGNCDGGGAEGMLTRVGKGWAVMVATEDPNRMRLILNFRNSSGSLLTLSSTHQLDLTTSDITSFENEELEFPENAFVFVAEGEISLDPDGPGTGTSPFNHFNNQPTWGGMSDDGSTFTIVDSFVDESGACDRAVSITAVGVRQRVF